jgi:hypothetical protein
MATEAVLGQKRPHVHLKLRFGIILGGCNTAEDGGKRKRGYDPAGHSFGGTRDSSILTACQTGQ